MVRGLERFLFKPVLLPLVFQGGKWIKRFRHVDILTCVQRFRSSRDESAGNVFVDDAGYQRLVWDAFLGGAGFDAA